MKTGAESYWDPSRPRWPLLSRGPLRCARGIRSSGPPAHHHHTSRRL